MPRADTRTRLEKLALQILAELRKITSLLQPADHEQGIPDQDQAIREDIDTINFIAPTTPTASLVDSTKIYIKNHTKWTIYATIDDNVDPFSAVAIAKRVRRDTNLPTKLEIEL